MRERNTIQGATVAGSRRKSTFGPLTVSTLGACIALVVGVAGCGGGSSVLDETASAASVEETALEPGSHASAMPTVSPTLYADLADSDESQQNPLPLRADLSPTLMTPPGGSLKLNSVQEIENDMRMLNEGALLGVNPSFGFAKGPGYVVMGNTPRGTNTPGWFKRAEHSLRRPDYWNAILPWFVLFEGVGNEATNTRIQIRNLKAFYKSKADGQWKLWGVSNDYGGSNCPQGSNYAACTGPSDKRAEPDGGVSFRPIPGMNFHGWWQLGRMPINPTDVAAVFVTAQTRLIQDTGSRPADRHKAKYLVHIGADYYPTPTYVFGSQAAPGVGLSRSKYITQDWRPVNFMTFSDVGIQEPGGGIALANVRAAPPPLD
jgi:hypothetical protein